MAQPSTYDLNLLARFTVAVMRELLSQVPAPAPPAIVVRPYTVRRNDAPLRLAEAVESTIVPEDDPDERQTQEIRAAEMRLYAPDVIQAAEVCLWGVPRPCYIPRALRAELAAQLDERRAETIRIIDRTIVTPTPTSPCTPSRQTWTR